MTAYGKIHRSIWRDLDFRALTPNAKLLYVHLVTHPKVMDAAVFGIPDDEMGQSVKGVVQLVDPVEASDHLADELLSWLRERLAHYKCPRSISFESALPRTDTGKLYKQSLIEKYSTPVS